MCSLHALCITSFMIRLTFWILKSDVPIMHCDTRNTKHEVKVTAFNDLCCAYLIKFWPSAAATGHVILASQG